jgi:hypothetical protein
MSFLSVYKENFGLALDDVKPPRRDPMLCPVFLEEEAASLRIQMERLLSPDRYQTSWDRGKSLDLVEVITGLLSQNQDAPMIETNFL